MTLTEGAPASPSAAPEAAPEPVPFGPGSLLWEQMGLYTSAVAGNSVFILQVMHPSIGTVVDRLSSFRTDPLGRAARSFASVQTWVYGGRTAIEEGRRLREMHKPLSAVDEEGRRHHALSAEPWAWVHLTGFYAAVAASRYFAPAPMTPDEEQQVFDEFLNLGRILRVPERMLPKTIPDYWEYFDDMVENTLVPHKVAYEVLDRMGRVPPGRAGAAAARGRAAQRGRRAARQADHRRDPAGAGAREARAAVERAGRAAAARGGPDHRAEHAAAARTPPLHADRLPRPAGGPRPGAAGARVGGAPHVTWTRPRGAAARTGDQGGRSP